MLVTGPGSAATKVHLWNPGRETLCNSKRDNGSCRIQELKIRIDQKGDLASHGKKGGMIGVYSTRWWSILAINKTEGCL
jgi:hypothetical protein